MQAQAGIGRFGLGRQGTGTGADGKNFLHQFDGEIDDTPTAEWAKVTGAIGSYLARGIDTGKGMLDVYFDKRIEFVVPQLHIVGGLQFFDQLRFHQQGFQFRAKHPRLDLLHILQQAVHLARIAQGLIIVRGQPVFKAFGFTDVNYLPIHILHQVDPGFVREVSFPRRIEEKRSGWANDGRLL